MTPARTEHFNNVNLLRAFAALTVVTYHVIEHSRWASFPNAGPLLFFRIGWLGVDLFFVISGFVIAYSSLILYRRSAEGFAHDYWLRRLSRIAPLYYLTLAAWIAIFWHGWRDAPFDWFRQLFTHLTFIHSFSMQTHGGIDGPNWSLGIEMHFYLAIWLLIGWIDRTPGWRIWLYGTLISWAWRACMLMLHGNADTFTLFVHVTQLPGTLDEFGAGIFLAKLVLDKRERKPLHAIFWLLGAVAAGYVTMAIFWDHSVYWNSPGMVIFWRTGVAVVILCALGAAVYMPQFLAHRWARPLDYLGEISYGIYLWHLFALTAALKLGAGNSLKVLGITLSLTLLFAALSWHLVEKPLMKRARA